MIIIAHVLSQCHTLSQHLSSVALQLVHQYTALYSRLRIEPAALVVVMPGIALLQSRAGEDTGRPAWFGALCNCDEALVIDAAGLVLSEGACRCTLEVAGEGTGCTACDGEMFAFVLLLVLSPGLLRAALP